MQLLPSLLFGISASLDALLVGIGYGLRKVHINLLQNFCISLVSMLGTCLSVCLGNRLLLFLHASLADRIGSIILILLGTYYILKWFLRSEDLNQSAKTAHVPEIASAERAPARLKPAETFFLSMTLSLNNIGIGLSASMAGLPLLPAAVTTLIFSALFLLCGNQLGQSRFLRLIGNAADPISGLLLIGLGIIQLAL